MAKTFSELVIEGPFLLVKGFLMGYKYSCNHDMEYFFHRKAGIRRETLKDLLQEYFELDSHTHVCLEDTVLERFSESVKQAEEAIKMKIRSRKRIVGASFSFHFEVFSKDRADAVRELINTVPATVKLEEFKDDEFENKEARGIEMYAPLHDYSYSGKGRLNGDFSDLVILYRTFQNNGNIECTQVDLVLKD